MKPTESNKRIDILDYLRGFALLGIILVNILPLFAVKLPAPGSADAAYQRFLFLFVEGIIAVFPCCIRAIPWRAFSANYYKQLSASRNI